MNPTPSGDDCQNPPVRGGVDTDGSPPAFISILADGEQDLADRPLETTSIDRRRRVLVARRGDLVGPIENLVVVATG